MKVEETKKRQQRGTELGSERNRSGKEKLEKNQNGRVRGIIELAVSNQHFISFGSMAA